MTYCLAIRVQAGLVFAADTRTNAGVDYVTTYTKLHVFQPADDRLFVVLSAGNLATTQQVLAQLRKDLDAGAPESLASVAYLSDVAGYLGRVSRAVQQEHARALQQSGVSGETTLIVGGQILGQPPDIFLVYPQGNYIEASDDTPFLQIGEAKYGKPMLDRIAAPSLSLEQAARLALVSLDATIRSNITVGPPFDLALYTADGLALDRHLRVEFDSPFYTQLRETWQGGIRQTFDALPRFDWEPEG